MFGVYIHIPFCKHICSYCDFPKQLPKNDEQMTAYCDRICEEIKHYEVKIKNCNTIYIGGGTPNALSPMNLEKVLKEIKCCLCSPIEFSIELNPELLTNEIADLLKKYGVNRVSLGVQTFHKTHLKFLNRHHTLEDVKHSITLLTSHGISNINLDMMYALPNQTLDDVKEDLNILGSLKIEHVSYYSLILEEHTVLNNLLNSKRITLPSDDLVGDMMDLIDITLPRYGFIHYEISNYAKPGFESKHNLIYWNCDPYLGIGMRACGYIDNKRYQNQHTLSSYMTKDFVEETTLLSKLDIQKEYFLLGLRKVEGVSISKFKAKFDEDPYKQFNLQKWIDLKLLETNGDMLRFSKKGMELGNLVFEEFI